MIMTHLYSDHWLGAADCPTRITADVGELILCYDLGVIIVVM